jgi:hypothetical protein
MCIGRSDYVCVRMHACLCLCLCVCLVFACRVNAHEDIAQGALHPVQSQLLAAEFSSFGNAHTQ